MRFRSNKGQSRIFSRIVVLVAYSGGLTGCGEIAFKRGSGPDSFAADRRHCQSETADPAAVRACLAQAGWHVTDMEAAGSPVPAGSPPPPEPDAAPVAVAPVVPPPDTPVPAAPAPTPKTLVVGNWWKIGTGGADLHAAGDACVAKLGPSNAPDAGYHTVSPAFYACLRSAGWHGQAQPQR